MNRKKAPCNLDIDMTQPLKALDLFSGIGGFSLALHDIATTVAYCDIDPTCRAVLTKHMIARPTPTLHKAPIFQDVKEITQESLAHHNITPNMITAGFPCTDISAANPKGLGIKGERSGLFREILRILDEVPSIHTLFMENSPRILHKGFRSIKASLARRGFRVTYCIASARDVGALHQRRRWYCLCTKPSAITQLKPASSNAFVPVPASLVPGPPPSTPRVLKITSPQQRKAITTRCQMLGNAVVPQCARHAWNTLVTQQPYAPLLIHSPLNITLDDGDHQIIKPYWATPTYSVWYQYRSVTPRGSGILANQLYYEQHTHLDHHIHDKKQTSHEYISNPVFVEFLMGYPKDWTKSAPASVRV